MLQATLVLDWAAPPLTENQRLHWAERNRRVQDCRTIAGLWGRTLRWRPDRLGVTLVWFVGDARKRDEDNIVPTLKALCDGLVDAGIVPDDTPRYMQKNMPEIIVRRGTRPHLELRLSEAPPRVEA